MTVWTTGSIAFSVLALIEALLGRTDLSAMAISLMAVCLMMDRERKEKASA